MTDYNDGKWHGWNGGECPVHPRSIVQIQLADETRLKVEKNAVNFHKYADDYFWEHASPIGANDIIAFRVVKEYRAPREFWIVNGEARSSLESALSAAYPCDDIIHVREVLE